MTRRDLAVLVVGVLLSLAIVTEARAQEPRCDTPVRTWPTEPDTRICGEWRCLTRRAFADEVLRPERELTACVADLRTERTLTAQLTSAHAEAVQARLQAEAAQQRMKRRRWAYVAAGAVGGVAVSVGVVWAGVQVVGAR